jgi:hypothetical protein
MKETTYYHKNSKDQAFWRAEWDNGYWEESTFNKRGQELTYKNADGFWLESTYDNKGKQTYFRNSRGVLYTEEK